MLSRNNRDIPEDVYVQFVRSLFSNRYTLIVGALCHSVIALVAFWNNRNPVFLAMAVLLLAVGLLRYAGIHRYWVLKPVLDRHSAARWERQYVFLGSIQGCLLGSFCFISIYLYPDPFAEIGAVSIALSSVVSVVGRNYGSPAMVAIFATTFIGPIAAALILRFELAYVTLGLLIIPFFFIVRGTAHNIRKVLFSAVIGHKKAGQLAQRFDRALNTMPHGLIMLDTEGRVVVANASAATLMGFADHSRLLGRPLISLLRRGVSAGLVSSEESNYLGEQLMRALREGRDRKILLSLSDGRHFEFSAREGRDELGVITFEEVTRRIEAEERIRQIARYDGLTGLANRTFFHERVADALRGGSKDRLCGLVVFDLDDFKSVNDTLGHPVGDSLLYVVSERLATFGRDNVLLSRFGGDEFMAFFSDLADEEDFAARIEHMFNSLQGDIDVAGHLLHVQMSAGAVLSTAAAADVDSMIVQSDLALYRAKELGKNGWQLFRADMDEAFRKKQLLKADLRGAIENHSLRVVFQPIVSVQTMKVVSCEALCRWDHPEFGPVSPGIFIPLAEEMGIVSDISTQMLDAACRRCAEWPEHICVSINLSAKDFRNGNIIDKVRNALASSGIAPNRLEIEVTETALLDDKASTREYIARLKDLGVKIALDDFGTGYSSLSYLHSLPLDKIKIDGSFVVDVARSERSLELLKGVVELSHRLGLAVTVEGVETFEQLSMLVSEVKPELLQGFLFGSALSANGVATIANRVWSFEKSRGTANTAAMG